jgi:hypothetical protein
VAVAVEGHDMGPGELARTFTVAADAEQELALGREALDTIVEAAHPYPAVPVHLDGDGPKAVLGIAEFEIAEAAAGMGGRSCAIVLAAIQSQMELANRGTQLFSRSILASGVRRPLAPDCRDKIGTEWYTSGQSCRHWLDMAFGRKSSHAMHLPCKSRIRALSHCTFKS